MTLSQSEIDSLLTSDGAGAGQPVLETDRVNVDLFKNASPEVRRILNLTVPVNVTLADRDMKISAILGLTVGSIIEFEVSFDADLGLNIGNHSIGHGQAVKVGENFGLRVSDIGTVHDRIDAMGE